MFYRIAFSCLLSGLYLPLVIVVICYKNCKVATNIGQCLKVYSKWFKKLAKKSIFTSFRIFKLIPTWLLLFLHSLKMGHIRNTEQLLDTPFWLKPWLKSNLLGSNFFYLANLLATRIAEPGLALYSKIIIPGRNFVCLTMASSTYGNRYLCKNEVGLQALKFGHENINDNSNKLSKYIYCLFFQ